jgi:transcriptional regulator with XRE-family HTH domain
MKTTKEKLRGNRINECLFKRNMSRAELIDITGLDASFVAKIVNNKKGNLNVTTAHKIAKALNYPIEIVFIFN